MRLEDRTEFVLEWGSERSSLRGAVSTRLVFLHLFLQVNSDFIRSFSLQPNFVGGRKRQKRVRMWKYPLWGLYIYKPQRYSAKSLRDAELAGRGAEK